MSYYQEEPPEKNNALVWITIVGSIIIFLMLIGCGTVRASSSLHPMREDKAISSFVVREKGSEEKIIVGRAESLWKKTSRDNRFDGRKE